MKDETLLQSREYFISLCNKFWNWQELDEITSGEEEPRLEWNGQEFTHRVTQALWRMYQAAIQSGNSAHPVTVPDELIHHDKDPEVTKAYKIGFNACLAVVKSATVTVPAGYVLVPVEPTPEMMLHKSGCQHHAWNDPDCPMRETRRLVWSHMLAAAPQSPGSQLTTAPGWTGNGNANAALVMLDRIDTLDPADDDRIEEVKQIVRFLAEPAAPDGWIPVSERMPPCKTGVLVATEMDGPGDWRMKWATYVPEHPDAINGWLIPGASWTPTHWQHLPDAPKGV